MFNIILATDNKYGIARDGVIPWYITEDLRFFRQKTANNYLGKRVIIMGRKTSDTLPDKYLPNRINIIITSQQLEKPDNDVYYAKSLNDALDIAEKLSNSIWVIGGNTLYKEAFRHYKLKNIYHTFIHNDYNCDIFTKLPKSSIIKETFVKCLNNVDITIYKLKPIVNAEIQYLQLLDNVLQNGTERNTRNGTTRSLFGKELVFDVSTEFPLLTTKKMFLKGIIEELLFFIRGETDTKKLMDKGINIWKGNTSKEFLEKLNLPYEEGIMGPMYGYQWRYFGKPYTEDNSEKYVDQLKNLINTLKNDPTSRRLLITDFNPLMVDMGVLYPCHSIVLQFYVENNNLSVKMYQRSADLFLGLPFNIASTTILLYIIAKLVNMKPHMVHITLGDCHIYMQHYDVAKEQLSRTPYNLPQLIIPDFNTLEQVETSDHTHFKLENYISNPAIKADMII